MSPSHRETSLWVLRGGGERTRRTLLDPWDPDCAHTFTLPYYFFAIDHPGGWTLVDCGIHPALVGDPRARLGDAGPLPDLEVGPEDDVTHQLARIGVAADQVEHVVLTHMHYDHCGGLALLPSATVHVQSSERAFAEHPPAYQATAYGPADWDVTLPFNEVQGEHDLFGDGSVVSFPTPGHTPGHQSVHVRLADREVILVGDAAYTPDKMRERRLPAFLWSPDAVLASWEELERRRRRTDATFVFSHHPTDAAGA